MSFEEYEPKGMLADPIPEGYASIDRVGTLCIRREDLELVAITAETGAAVLTDDLTMRIALRKPRPGRRALSLQRVFRGKQPDPKWARIGLAGAIKSMRLEPVAVSGRYELRVKEDLLIVCLADADEEAPATARAEHETE